MVSRAPRSALFPYTTLFRSVILEADASERTLVAFRYRKRFQAESGRPGSGARKRGANGADLVLKVPVGTVDRKSTRLNSSHVRTSYAVFCWKKKNREINRND